MYYYPYRNSYNNYQDDRFIIPFLLGGLAGGALVGVSRPRPVYVNNPNGYYPNNMNYPYPYGAYNNSYYGYY